jgi:hypothetical protein
MDGILFIGEVVCIHESEDWNRLASRPFAEGPLPQSTSAASGKLDALIIPSNFAESPSTTGEDIRRLTVSRMVEYRSIIGRISCMFQCFH